MLELGSEEAVEIVFDDEDAKEVGITARAQDVPGQGHGAERNDCDGMKQTKRVAPAFRHERPEKHGAAGENNRRRAFGENGKAKKKTEQD